MDGTPHSVTTLPFYGRSTVAVTLVTVVLATGLSYVSLQWLRRGESSDALFVSMLVGATMVLSSGLRGMIRYVGRGALGFLLEMTRGADGQEATRRYDRLRTFVFNARLMTASGLAYGSVVAAAPFVLGIWPEDVALRASLGAFLFAVNFLTGVAFYSLVAFFVYALQLGGHIEVNLWQLSNPVSDFLLGVTRRIGGLAAVYAALSNTSILFSQFPVGPAVIAYFCFSALVIAASVVVPPIPLMRKLQTAKNRALVELDKQLHLSFYESLEKTASLRADVDFGRVKTLLELRDRIEAIATWPFRAKTIATVVSVFAVSSVPVVLQVLLERVFR